MARTTLNTLLTAQSASARTPYLHMIFTSYDEGTTVDLSSDSATYGDRIVLIDHAEESYNDYSVIILSNYDLSIPDLMGYYVDIGFGDVTGTGNEYCGDGTNGGDNGMSRLWVKHQQFVSIAGKLLCILELEGKWAKLRETLLRMGSAPFYTAKTADDDFGSAKTPYDILKYLLTNEVDPAMTLAALSEDDGIMDTYEPNFEVNYSQNFEYFAEIAYMLVKMTNSFLKPMGGLNWEIKYPQSSDSIDLTYTTSQFYEHTERKNLVIPNRIYLFANAGADLLWAGMITAQDDNEASQASYGIVSDV